MRCELYVDDDVQQNRTTSEAEQYEEQVDPVIQALARYEKFIDTRVVVTVCCFGVLGNMLNLLALTRRSLVSRMGKMEKSSTAGLVGLALSDFFFCLFILPKAFVDSEKTQWFSLSFEAIYTIHSTSVLNIFVVSSTWLTVVMAISRYLAICYPIHARLIVGIKFAAGSMVAVFVGSIILNLPRFWYYTLECTYLSAETKLQFPQSKPRWYDLEWGPLSRTSTGYRAYIIVYFVLAVLVPLITLAFCNVYLVRALRQSAKMRNQMRRHDQDSGDTTRVVTLTLTVIVVANILLVAPCEIFTFVDQIAFQGITDRRTHSVYNFVVCLLNVLQMISFSFNFVLYILINAHFRRAIKEILTCKRGSSSNSRNSRMSYDSMTQQTTVPLTCISTNGSKNETESKNYLKDAPL